MIATILLAKKRFFERNKYKDNYIPISVSLEVEKEKISPFTEKLQAIYNNYFLKNVRVDTRDGRWG